MKIRILSSAHRDIGEGRRFYECQAEGVGTYFMDSIFSDIDSLYVTAGIHTVHFGYHRMLSKRFPFAVYYKREGDTVTIYAVLDYRRDPAWARTRLPK